MGRVEGVWRNGEGVWRACGGNGEGVWRGYGGSVEGDFFIVINKRVIRV